MYVGAFNIITEHMIDFNLFGVYFVLLFFSCLKQIINYTSGYQYFLVGVPEPCLIHRGLMASPKNLFSL
jgi:hypothetical protein